MINKIVVITNSKLVLKPKFEEANTLGIIKKIIKGFTIPPVEYIKAPNWEISINRNKSTSSFKRGSML